VRGRGRAITSARSVAGRLGRGPRASFAASNPRRKRAVRMSAGQFPERLPPRSIQSPARRSAQAEHHDSADLVRLIVSRPSSLLADTFAALYVYGGAKQARPRRHTQCLRVGCDQCAPSRAARREPKLGSRPGPCPLPVSLQGRLQKPLVLGVPALGRTASSVKAGTNAIRVGRAPEAAEAPVAGPSTGSTDLDRIVM
jgi:hypothetical protein